MRHRRVHPATGRKYERPTANQKSKIETLHQFWHEGEGNKLRNADPNHRQPGLKRTITLHDRKILRQEINRAVKGQTKDEVSSTRDAQIASAKQSEINERFLVSELDNDEDWDKDRGQNSTALNKFAAKPILALPFFQHCDQRPRPIAMEVIPIQSPLRKSSSC